MNLELLGHAGFILLALSYVVKDILILRLLAILANFLFIPFNYFVPEEPLWVVINWSILFLTINVIQIGLLFKERRGVHFTPEEQELHETVFRSFSAVEFMKLLRIGQWIDAKPGYIIAQEGHKSDRLLIISHGRASVEIDTKNVAELGDGTFVGEMGYVTDDAASATVTTTAETRLLSWSTKDLRGLLQRNPHMYFAMQAYSRQT